MTMPARDPRICGAGMKLDDVLTLPTGRIFITKTDDWFTVEASEMRAVSDAETEYCRGASGAWISDEPRMLWKNLVPWNEKWHLSISVQKGCPFGCRFCDATNFQFRGNLTREEIEEQVKIILKNTPYIQECACAEINFSRMGEPALNLDNIFAAIGNLKKIARSLRRKIDFSPRISSILPLSVPDALERMLRFREEQGGNLNLAINCNSTSETVRRELLGGADVMPLADAVRLIKEYPAGRNPVVLNFIAMKNAEVDMNILKSLDLDEKRFLVRLSPLNRTKRAEQCGLSGFADDLGHIRALKDSLDTLGIPSDIGFTNRCEETGICGGQVNGIESEIMPVVFSPKERKKTGETIPPASKKTQEAVPEPAMEKTQKKIPEKEIPVSPSISISSEEVSPNSVIRVRETGAPQERPFLREERSAGQGAAKMPDFLKDRYASLDTEEANNKCVQELLSICRTVTDIQEVVKPKETYSAKPRVNSQPSLAERKELYF